MTASKKVLRQVEYYFGNVNMMRDSFMKEEIKKDQGWITLETMMNFKRLAEMTENKPEKVIEAIKEHKSDLMEVSECSKKIRRSPENPIPSYDDNYKRLEKNRTCYVKGFPETETLDSLQDFFDPYGFESVYMMRVKLSKQFKGSIFVTFKTQELADKFMNEASTKFNDTELEKMTKTAFYDKGKGKDVKGNEKREPKKTLENDEDALKRIIKFSGITDDTVGREEVIECLTDVDFTSFARGQTEGLCVLNVGSTASDVVSKLEKNPVEIRTAKEVKFEALEGDAAEEARKTLAKEKEELFAKLKNRKSNRGRNGARGGGRPGGRGGPKNKKIKFDDSEPAEKKAKTEE